MSKNKLAAIIIPCTIAIIVVIIVVIVPLLQTPIYTLSISVSPPTSGSVEVQSPDSVSPDSNEYETDTQVELTATSSSDWEFASWSGDATGTSPTITIIMNSDKSVTANFKEVLVNMGRTDIFEGNWLSSPGIHLQQGQTVTLSWSSSGYLDCYIFTQTQYNNFKDLGYRTNFEYHSSGEGETTDVYISNSDVYYVVVLNRFITVAFFEAKLTLQ